MQASPSSNRRRLARCRQPRVRGSSAAERDPQTGVQSDSWELVPSASFFSRRGSSIQIFETPTTDNKTFRYPQSSPALTPSIKASAIEFSPGEVPTAKQCKPVDQSPLTQIFSPRGLNSSQQTIARPWPSRASEPLTHPPTENKKLISSDASSKPFANLEATSWCKTLNSLSPVRGPDAKPGSVSSTQDFTYTRSLRESPTTTPNLYKSTLQSSTGKDLASGTMVVEREPPRAPAPSSKPAKGSLPGQGTAMPVFGAPTALNSPMRSSDANTAKDTGHSSPSSAATRAPNVSGSATVSSTQASTGSPSNKTGASSAYAGAPSSSIFNVPKAGRPRPEHHRPAATTVDCQVSLGEKPPASFRDPFAPRIPAKNTVKEDPGATKIQAPSQPVPKALYPQPPVMYSSLNPTTGAFQSVNQFSTAGSARNPYTLVDDELFADKFAAPDLYQYVDPAKANAQIKALLEGAFGDDDEKPKTRRKRKEMQDKAKELGEKLKALNIKAKSEARPNEEADGNVEDEVDEEEDDGEVDGLMVKLLPHQIVGVDWMRVKELGAGKGKSSISRGGMLADDMGLGKTIQTLALILTNPRPPISAPTSDDGRPRISENVGKQTLVVAPLALIKQWESEIKTKVDEEKRLRVLVHHGPQRTKRSQDLRKYDVVITTYQTLVSEHGSHSDDNPFACFGVHWYRIVLDEAHSIKNRNAKATKACKALRAHYRWCLTGTPVQNNLEELQSLVAFLNVKPYRELSVWKEHIIQPLNNGRGELAIRRLQTFLKAIMLRRTKKVLNAHRSEGKDESTDGGSKSKTTFKLPGRKVEMVTCEFSSAEKEFYDALALKTDKRIEQLMQGTKMNYTSALTLLLRLRQACNHTELVKRALGADKDALSTGPTSGMQTPKKQADRDIDAMADLLGGLTVGTKECDICLAELSTKESSAGMIRCSDCQKNLNQQDVAMKKEKRDKKTRKQKAASLEKHQKTRKVLDDSDDEGEGDWVIPEDRRRIADLGKAGGTDDENVEGGGEWLASDDTDTGDESSIVDLGSHKKKRYEVQSINSTVQSESDVDDDDDESEDSSSSDSSSNLLASTKIQQLIGILQRETHEHKFIVFSQFTSMLDLLEPFLKRARLDFVRYDGSMRNDAREASLDSLRHKSSTRVLLCSLKCGSLGLNLTAASRVVILEPFWNPFVEEQAIDRVHRLNQTRDVRVYRLTVKGTVEESIFELQEKKRALAEAAIEGGQAAKLSMRDMLDLFKHGAEQRQPGIEEAEHGEEGSSQMARTQLNGVPNAPNMNKSQHDGQRRKIPDDPIYGRRW